jgi:hypothetical protein
VDIFKVAVSQHSELLATAPSSMTKDASVMLAAIAEDPLVLIHASPSLVGNKTFVKHVVAKYAMALRYLLAADLRANKEVIMAAVQHSGMALQYALEELKVDKEIVLMAFSKHAGALQYTTSVNLWKDKQIWMALLAQHGNHLAEAPEECRSDKECVLAAVCSCNGSLKYALGGLNQDQDWLVAAGLWDEGYNPGAPKVVLSTRFALNAESSATATEFTVLLKKTFLISRRSRLHSFPDAFNKNSCDPEWTQKAWPCRGTSSCCKMQDMALKSGVRLNQQAAGVIRIDTIWKKQNSRRGS